MSQAFHDAFSGYGIISLIVVGLILGVIGRMLASGDQNIPWWLTIVAGIVGALVGNILSGLFGVRHTNGIDWIRHILQIICAVGAVILASRMYSGSRTRA